MYLLICPWPQCYLQNRIRTLENLESYLFPLSWLTVWWTNSMFICSEMIFAAKCQYYKFNFPLSIIVVMIITCQGNRNCRASYWKYHNIKGKMISNRWRMKISCICHYFTFLEHEKEPFFQLQFLLMFSHRLVLMINSQFTNISIHNSFFKFWKYLFFLQKTCHLLRYCMYI